MPLGFFCGAVVGIEDGSTTTTGAPVGGNDGRPDGGGVGKGACTPVG